MTFDVTDLLAFIQAEDNIGDQWRSVDVPPRLAANDLTHRGGVDAVLEGELSPAFLTCGEPSSDLGDLSGGQFRLRVQFALVSEIWRSLHALEAAPAFHHVLKVLLLSTNGQVSWFETGWGIAEVMNLQAFGDRANECLIGDAGYEGLLSANSDAAIAAPVDAASPEQVAVLAPAMAHETVNDGESRILTGHRRVPSGGVVPPAVASSAGVSCMDYII
jgi:hypothetical protein